MTMCRLHFCPAGVTVIIQPMPKWSSTIPKRGDQNVFVSGIRTRPPSAAWRKLGRLRFRLGRKREGKALEAGLSAEQPSDAITVVWPMRRLACMILFSKRVDRARREGSGAVLEAHHDLDFGAEGFR